jgi:FAD:protein FMN transferase
MEDFRFKALGTAWSLMIDEPVFREGDKKVILDEVAHFEERFSRFLPESEVNQFREALAGTYTISSELTILLGRADILRGLTNGVYDPAIGALLEHAGYDPTYRMEPDQEVADYQLPEWSLAGDQLTLAGPIVFDLGGIGKGYCIDMVATTLKRLGYEYFLVEGGGDMYGTSKHDGSGFRIALEWPGQSDTAFGVVELKHHGIAVSDSFKRRWGNWHHIIDPHTKKPIERIIGATAVAPSAFAADCMTSGLFLSSPEEYKKLAQVFCAEFVVFKNNGTIQISQAWTGTLF